MEATSSQLLPYRTAVVPEPRSGTGSGCSGRVRARQVGTITFPAACGCTGGCLCHPDYLRNPASPWSECIHFPADTRFPTGTHRESPLSPSWAAPMAPGSPPAPAGSPPRLSRATRGPGTPGRATSCPRGPSCCARPCDASTGTPRPCPLGHRTAPIRSLPPALCPRRLPSKGPSRAALLAAVPGPGPVLRPRGSPSPSAGTSAGPRGPRAGSTATGRSGARSPQDPPGTGGRSRGCGGGAWQWVRPMGRGREWADVGVAGAGAGPPRDCRCGRRRSRKWRRERAERPGLRAQR